MSEIILPTDGDSVVMPPPVDFSRAWQVTVPLMVGDQPYNIRPHGTGTLLRVADASFLVTAGHVVALAVEHDLKLAAGIESAGGFVSLSGSPWATADDDEKLDVCLWRLPEEVAKIIPDDHFLRLHEIDLSIATGTDDWFYSMGYPVEWSTGLSSPTDTSTIAPFQFGTQLYQGSTGAFANYVPEQHLLLASGPDGVVDLSGDGYGFPRSLKGISGCGVWRVVRNRSPRGPSHTLKIAAVETCVYVGKPVIRATSWRVVLQVLRQRCPELESALKLTLSIPG